MLPNLGLIIKVENQTSVIKREKNSLCTHTTETTPVKAEQNTRQHQTVSEGSPPSLTTPLGILCIGDPFGDLSAESGTQVSCPHSMLYDYVPPDGVCYH